MRIAKEVEEYASHFLFRRGSSSRVQDALQRCPEKNPWQLTGEQCRQLAHYSYETFESLPPMPLKCLSRKEATLLMRVRTGSAFTRSWLIECTGQIDTTCTACEAHDAIQYDLLECPDCHNRQLSWKAPDAQTRYVPEIVQSFGTLPAYFWSA